MRSGTSFFDRTIYRKNLTHFWVLWVLYAGVMALMVPINIFVRCHDRYTGYTAEEMQAIHTFSCVYGLLGAHWSACLAMAAGTVIAMTVFGYLYNQRAAHAFHAMPLSRTTLFFSNYISGLTILLLPPLLAFCIGVITAVLSGVTALEYIFAWLLMYLVESFFFYTMAVFVGMLTGQLWLLPFFQIIFNVLYIGMRYIITSLMGIIGYGLSQSYANRRDSMLSPLVFMSDRIGMAYKENDILNQIGYEFRLVGFSYLGLYLLVGVLLLAGAFFLYRRRKIENTGDVLAFPQLRPMFRWGVSVCASFLSAILVDFFLGYIFRNPREEFVTILLVMMAGGCVFFFIAQMLLCKKVLVFERKRVAECGVVVFLVLLVTFGIRFDVMGIEKKIPDAEEIKKAKVSMYYGFELCGEEEIEEVRALHRQILDSRQEFLAYQSDSALSGEVSWVEIDYFLKDGGRMVRSYAIPASRVYQEDASSVVSRLYDMSMEPENYLRGMMGENYNDIKIRKVSMELYDEELNREEVILSEVQSRRLYRAYVRDIREGHIVLRTSDEETEQLCYVNYAVVEHILNEKTQDRDYIYLDLNTTCSYSIRALKEMGIVDEEWRLMTEAEYEQLCEDYYSK